MDINSNEHNSNITRPDILKERVAFLSKFKMDTCFDNKCSNEM